MESLQNGKRFRYVDPRNFPNLEYNLTSHRDLDHVLSLSGARGHSRFPPTSILHRQIPRWEHRVSPLAAIARGETRWSALASIQQAAASAEKKLDPIESY